MANDDMPQRAVQVSVDGIMLDGDLVAPG